VTQAFLRVLRVARNLAVIKLRFFGFYRCNRKKPVHESAPMNQALHHAILTLLLSAGVTLADPPDPKEKALGYYRNLGAMAFDYSATIYRLEPDAAKKTQDARQYWFAAFHYWYDVREKTIPGSKSIFKAIWKLGPSVFSPEDLKLYSDPLGWVGRDKPLMTFGGINKEQYEQARVEFGEWIEKEFKNEERPADEKPLN
jgi:hypothetical protein